MTRPVVAFAGMTHLGLVSATAVASAGFETVCFDKDTALIARLKKGDLPVVEPDLPELLRSNGRRQMFTPSVRDIGGCDVVYVAPDVSTDDEGRSNSSVLVELINLIVPAMSSPGHSCCSVASCAWLHPRVVCASARTALLPGRNTHFWVRSGTRDKT